MTNKTVEENKAIIVRLIEEVWNNNDTRSVDDLLDQSYYDYSYMPRNREGFERTLAAMQEAFPGHQTTIEEIVVWCPGNASCIAARVRSKPSRLRGM